ncbi:MAG: methyl-accepting chemotaxis protein, partial [Acidovorax sp.]|nr:methyl-accepting chemotaxis protein [Acidovorax sp.]
DIKILIDNSVTEVERGTTLADQAGTTMTEVVSAIRRVTDLIAEVSAASNEQSQGVGQVGEAVSQMDQVTQQNAALVEESAAAANSLSAQAQQLQQAVAVFKLAGSSYQAAAVQSVVPRAVAVPAAIKATAKAVPARQLAARVSSPKMGQAPAQPAADNGDWESF